MTCRRMWSSSLTMTLMISLGAKATPRGPSLFDWVRLFRFIRVFLLPNQVAQSGGFLVGFALDGGSQLLSQVAQLVLLGGMLQGMNGDLAHVLDAAMNPLQKRQQRGAK